MAKTPSTEHGIRATYVQGCRCDDCKTANSRYQTEWRSIGADLYQLPRRQYDGHLEWIEHGLCRDPKFDKSWWFPETRGGSWAVRELAVSICNRCPVQAECREYGRTEKYGIWGGESAGESSWGRRRRLNQRRASGSDTAA